MRRPAALSPLRQVCTPARQCSHSGVLQKIACWHAHPLALWPFSRHCMQVPGCWDAWCALLDSRMVVISFMRGLAQGTGSGSWCLLRRHAERGAGLPAGADALLRPSGVRALGSLCCVHGPGRLWAGCVLAQQTRSLSVQSPAAQAMPV